MDKIVAVFISVLSFFTSGFHGYRPEKNKKPTIIPTIGTTVTVTPSISPVLTPLPSYTTIPMIQSTTTIQVPTDSQKDVYTPTNITTQIDGEYPYVITMRSNETIRVTTFVPMKGHRTINVELPPSGAPTGVYFTQDQADARNVFIHTNSSVLPGTYKWRQSFSTTSTSGVASGNLSLAIILHILPAR